MSEGYCKTMMLGNVGAEPEVRMTQGGTAVLNLRIAVNTTFLDKDKVKRERVSWFTVVCFGKRAEALGRTLAKGSTLFIECEPRARSYDDKDGNKRSVVEFHLLDVKFCGGRKGASSEDGSLPRERSGRTQAREDRHARGAPPAGAPADDYEQGGYGGDDDIPFVHIGAAPETDGIPRGWL